MKTFELIKAAEPFNIELDGKVYQYTIKRISSLAYLQMGIAGKELKDQEKAGGVFAKYISDNMDEYVVSEDEGAPKMGDIFDSLPMEAQTYIFTNISPSQDDKEKKGTIIAAEETSA